MPDSDEYADVEIVEDEPSAAAPPPNPGATREKSTGSPQHGAQISPEARDSIGLIASVLGLCGFTLACVVGLSTGLPGTQVLLRAVGAMFACWFVGLLLSKAMLLLIREHLQRHYEAHPRPVRPPELDASPDRSRKAA
ncbi:MAG: hypothetical protein ACI89L_002001 [Phycisphaerales bacterium]|jgi:hypothetical protein